MSNTTTRKLTTGSSRAVRKAAQRYMLPINDRDTVIAGETLDDFTVSDIDGNAVLRVDVIRSQRTGRLVTVLYNFETSREVTTDGAIRYLASVVDESDAPALVSDITLTDSGRAKLASMGYVAIADDDVTPAPAVNLDPHLTALPAAPVASPVGWPVTIAIPGTPEMAAMIDAATVEQAESITYVKAHYYVGNLGSYLSGVQILALYDSEIIPNSARARKIISRRVFDSPVYAHLITISKFERM